MGVQVKFRDALQAENAGGVETSVAPVTVYLLTSYLVLGVRGVLSWFTSHSRIHANMDYNDYLRSDYWKQRRYAALERVEFRCQLCGESDSLDVHHLTYERLGNEDPADLYVICRSHHWMQHNPPALPAVPIPQPEPVPVRVYARCRRGQRIYRKLMSCKPRSYKLRLNCYNNHADHCRVCSRLPDN